MAYNNGSFSNGRTFQNKKKNPFQNKHYAQNTNSTMIMGDTDDELSFSSMTMTMTQSKPNHRNDNTAVYEEETTLDMGTVKTITTNPTSSNYATPITTTTNIMEDEDTMYDDDMDDYDDDGYGDEEEEDDDDAEETELEDTAASKPVITPLPDEYGDYDDNYEDYYEDVNYAADPPKKKKYRESDASINNLRYDDAVKQRSAEIKDKYEKRYSKYDNDFYDDLSMRSEYKENSKLVSHHSNNGKGGGGGIELSVTEEIAANSDASQFAKEMSATNKEMSKKELSLYFNKKTQDKYDKFEMNTYSSDSTDDSGVIKAKYLKDPITPGPEDLDTKYTMDIGDPFETHKSNGSYSTPTMTSSSTQIKMNFSKKDNMLSPIPQKPPKINKDASDIDHHHNRQRSKKGKKREQKERKKKKITLKDFMSVDLERFVKDNDSDNFDVAKAVCKFYDNLCADTDTVTIVADKGKGPNTAYWSKGDYNRVEKDCLGKYIMVYRACKHVEAKIKVKQDIFESCVKGLCMDNLGHSQLIADKLDCVFGEGCHVSLASHDDFEVFCRYSDGYICEVELPNDKDFVVAWRR